MRILILTNLYPNPYQPHRAMFNAQQLRALAVHHDLRIIAPITWTDELAARWKRAGSLPRDRRVVHDGIPVEHPRYWYPPRILRSCYGHFYRWSVRSAFERALEEFAPDLVYSPWAYPDGWAAVDLGHRAGLPVVIKVHGSDVLLLHQHPDRRGRTAEALRRADAVIAVSRDLARNVIALGADSEKVVVEYCGINAALFHPGSRSEARAKLNLDQQCPVILFIGNLLPVKGIDNLIAACARLKQFGRRFACYLIGQGPLKSNLERQLTRAGLAGWVTLLGSRPHATLPDWYRAADVLVLPSHSEGVPNVLLEAAACGTPFVASRVGGVPEIAHLGLSRLVPPGDVAALAEAIGASLDDPAARLRTVPPVLRSQEETAASLAGVFEKVLAQHTACTSVAFPLETVS